jgi:hypothetical protein
MKPVLLFCLVASSLTCGAATSRADSPQPPRNSATAPRSLEMRVGVETLRNPYWYADQGFHAEADRFWDKTEWDRILRAWADEHYTALIFWIEPWNKHGWQTFLIRHERYPEARGLTDEQSSRLIEHLNWIFHRAHELGLKNLLFTYSIVTTPEFAAAHGLENLPVSESVDFRHTLREMGPHFGVRNKLTAEFTRAAIAELFATYPDLDGLYGTMGEAVPGRRSGWYREAIAPGLKASGRDPMFLASTWMQPFEEFKSDMAPAEVYGNTWLAVHSNGEVFTDAKPYPAYARWLEDAHTPTIVEVMHHNLEHGFPFNSPRLAWDIIHECRKFEDCRGFLAWFSVDHPDSLMRQALAYYAEHPEPYSDEPWIATLQQKFGDRDAAAHFVNAYNASARIIPELSALAWVPHDLGTSRVLLLPYWYWTDDDPRWNYLASPSRAGLLLPVRYYAQVVARLGDQFRDNSGADPEKNREHPGSQELMWGLGDYPITPEAHMRHIRALGEESLREAELALLSVKDNRQQAEQIYRYMRAYKLLADYYEQKVLAATTALIYRYGGDDADRQLAEHYADAAVECYSTAITFIWKEIDQERGAIKGRWLGGSAMTLPELIEREEQEREQLPQLFRWDGAKAESNGTGRDTPPRAGTFVPGK